MIKYRDHRGGLSESMETYQEFETMDEVRGYVAKSLYPYCVDVTKENFHSKFYCDKDERIGWKPVCLVTVDGFGVVGWTDKESV